MGLEGVRQVYSDELAKRSVDAPGFRERLFKKLGFWSLIAFASVGFGFVFAIAAYYKFQIFGAEMMAGFGVFGFLLLGALSVLFFAFGSSAARKRLRSGRTEEGGQVEGTPTRILDEGHTEAARTAFEGKTNKIDHKLER
ncbi:MAG TPA: hypothetical protein VMM38_07760 [Aridibacter sp.]|nr:hypothetical protein [Aridibacter sp.]